jgi:hypothetical protein
LLTVTRRGPPCTSSPGEGKRTEQHSIDHTEYRRVRADAESEGEDGDSREARGLAQHAEAEANVLQELLEPNETPHLAYLFFDAGHIADLRNAA